MHSHTELQSNTLIKRTLQQNILIEQSLLRIIQAAGYYIEVRITEGLLYSSRCISAMLDCHIALELQS